MIGTELIVGLAAVTFVYLFPTYLALVRKHVDWQGVLFVNILIGWTIVGWFILLVWALDTDKTAG
jgi:hypothetical protein